MTGDKLGVGSIFQRAYERGMPKPEPIEPEVKRLERDESVPAPPVEGVSAGMVDSNLMAGDPSGDQADMIERELVALAAQNLDDLRVYIALKELSKRSLVNAKTLEKQYKAIAKAVQKNNPPSGGVVAGAPFGSDKYIADAVIEDVGKGDLLFAESRFHWWSGKVWEPIDEVFIQKAASDAYLSFGLGANITSSKIASVSKIIKAEVASRHIQFDPPSRVINVDNGELTLTDEGWVLSPHRRESFRLSLLPVEYVPDAEAPEFTKFLNTIFQGDEDCAQKKQALLEFLGYSLTTDCRFEKFMMMIGGGENGKSTMLQVVEALLGRHNICAVDPAQFDNRFQLAHIRGKFANIVPELKEGLVINDAVVKQIASGELVTAEQKYMAPFDFRPYAKGWFGTNHMPHTSDLTHGFFRKCIVLQFNNRFRAAGSPDWQERDLPSDPGLKDKLLAELPGILNLALGSLEVLYLNKTFCDPQSSIMAKAAWKFEADQAAQFVDECCQTGPALLVEAKSLFAAYQEWARKSGITRMLNKNSFGRRMTALGFRQDRTELSRYRKGIDIDLSKSG